MAYLLLFVPAFVAAAAHWAFMPKFAEWVLKEFAGVALPLATTFVMRAAPIMYSAPVAILCLAFLAGRFGFLKHPTVIGGLGAALALGLYVYGIGTMLPLITLFDTIGNR
jgi:hypothetical protein